MHTATYSPEDNKLRLYPECRLDKEEYQKVRAMGFIWAPKQGLFVAPMWTPSREDFLINLCGEIGDEDTSLVNRAEERADRFENYSDKRKSESKQAHDYVKSITDHIPLGQPILVGHHSERRARKDAERIENGMRKSIKLWETSEYWKNRAAGAIRHAKYKERSEVRARRIKKIEADKRRNERSIKEAEKFLKLWTTEGLTKERAVQIANYDHVSACFTLEKYPREHTTYEGSRSLWSALTNNIIDEQQAKNIAVPCHKNIISCSQRWINHFNNRLIYEKAMLDEQGASDLLKPKLRPKQLPLCNYKADSITYENPWHRGEFITVKQIEMTKEEYAKVYNDYKYTVTVENSHRVRGISQGMKGRYVVFITDSKVHGKPAPIEKKSDIKDFGRFRDTVNYPTIQQKQEDPDKDSINEMKEALKQGTKVVSAPQLFPTPPVIAEKMVDYAELNDNCHILEPSAGTGNILRAIGPRYKKTAVEINEDIAKLAMNVSDTHMIIGDFLQMNGELGEFDRIIMNPPFENGSDIKHIKHAITYLSPGGVLVALCANGPRQNEILKPIAEYWEILPTGSFKESGTNVNVAMMVYRNEE